MIVERVYRQRCWPEVAGTDEIAIIYRHRRRDLTKPHPHRARRPAIPRGPARVDRQIRFWWEGIDLEEPTEPHDRDRPHKRSLHPGKLTLAERAQFRPLPRGWDADRPRCRADCVADRPCPHCGETVAMRLSYATAPAMIVCPACRGYVAYRPARGDQPWGWQKFNPRHPQLGDPDRLPMAARNRCRPCWMVRCRQHLYLEVKLCGSMRLNHPAVPPERMDLLADTCAQDVADRVEVEGVGRDPKVLPLEVVGAKLGLTLERARQLEAQALQEVHVRNMRNNSGET